MRRALRLLCATGLLVLGACTGEPPETAASGRDADSQATLAPETDADPAGEPADERPTSARFQLGTHYRRLSPTQPTSSSPEKIEVAEIFWYGCPHCFDFDPYLARWSRSKPDHVSFVRVPAVWNPLVRLHARAFYTAEVLGKGAEMHDAFFAEIHRNGNPLDSAEALAELFGRFGVERDAFEAAFDSYEVHDRLQRAEELGRRYEITSVPSIVVNGKYTTNASMAGGYEQLIELIGELTASEQPGA